MKQKILTILFAFMTALLLLSVWSSNNRANDLEDQITYWQNKAAQTSVIEIVDSSAIKQLALQVDELKSENDAINNQIKKQKAIIISQVNTIAELRDSLLNVDTGEGDTLIVDGDSVRTRTFGISKDAFKLNGWFMLDDPYEINFTNISAKIETETNLVENKDGSYQVFIDSKLPGVSITSTTPKLVPYDYKWYEKLRFGVGAYIGGEAIGLEGTVGYNKFGLDIGFDSNSQLILGGKYYFN